MSRNPKIEVLKKELKDVIRDKKTLVMMIVVPLVLFPVLFATLLILEDDMLDVDESAYNLIGFAFPIDETLNGVIEEVNVRKEEGSKEELKEKLDNGIISAYITKEDNNFTIYYSLAATYAQATVEKAYELLESYKRVIASYMLTQEGLIPDEIFEVYTIETKDLSNSDAYSEMMISMVPTFIIMTTILSAMFVSIDITAGEKERGTLETLFTFPLKSSDIIWGKYLACSICTMISSILGFTSMYLVLYFLSGSLETFENMELLTPSSIILAIATFMIFSMLISAICIVISSRAKGFKEAQNFLQPLAFVAIIPMFFSMMGIKINSVLAAIPLINTNLMLNDIILNQANILYFAIMVISSIIFIVLILKAISRLYKSDKILFS